MRAALDELSWSLLDATLSAVPRQVLTRAARIAAPNRDSLNPGMSGCWPSIERHAAGMSPVSSPTPASGSSAAQLR